MASDLHLPTLISETGLSLPEGGRGDDVSSKTLLRGRGGRDRAVQLHDADGPLDARPIQSSEREERGIGGELQCHTEPHTDYGGPIAFVWVGCSQRKVHDDTASP